MTITAVFETLTTIIGAVWGVFGDVASTIMNNPLLFVPVLLSLGGGLIFFAISVVRRLGIRGVSSGGRRRRRRG